MTGATGGGRPLFAAAEERDMATWLRQCAARGLVITRETFAEEVQRIVQLEQRCAKSDAELDQWISQFKSRHAADFGSDGLLPALEAAEREARRPPRAWYRSVSAALASRRHADDPRPFADPERVLYLGEVNLRLDTRAATVLSLRSAAAAAARPAASGDNVAYVQAVSASGERAPPMMVAPTGGVVRDDLDGQDCFRQTTSNGRVTPTALVQYLIKSLEPYLTARCVARPVLVYVDGLHHHCSMTLSQLCDDEGIVMVGLPPGGQARNPLSQAVSSLLAANFDRLVAEARLGRRKAGSRGVTLSLKYLLAGVRQASRRVCRETVRQAFRSSCLFPWGEGVVAACEPVDGPAEPTNSAHNTANTAKTAATSHTAASKPSSVAAGLNGAQQRVVAKPAGVTRAGSAATGSEAGRRSAENGCQKREPAQTRLVCQPDPDITIKREQLSPPRSPPATVWGTDLFAGPANTEPADYSDAEQEPEQEQEQEQEPDQEQDPEPDQLVLPQARLLAYLTALDAAGAALHAQRHADSAAVVLELKDKLRALHAASSALSADSAEPAAAATADSSSADSSESLVPEVCAVTSCDHSVWRCDRRSVRLHRFPEEPALAAVWLRLCGLPADTPVTGRLAVCSLHFSPGDLQPLPARSPGFRGRPPLRSLRKTAVPNRKLGGLLPPPAAPTVPIPASPSGEGRSARGIKRPKRFDDFQVQDDELPLRPTGPAPDATPPPSAGDVPPAPPPAPASADMTELANKPPAALKSIIRILRTENEQLRAQLEAERGRGRGLAAALERVIGDYNSGAPL